MCNVGVVLDVESKACRIDRSLQMQQIPFIQIFRLAIQRQYFAAGQSLMHLEHAMATMISRSNCYSLWVEECEQGMEGSEAGGVCQAWVMEERCKNGFETRAAGSGVPRVAVFADAKDGLVALVERS